MLMRRRPMAVWRGVSREGTLLKQVVTFPSYLLLPNAESELGGGGGSADLLRECNANGHSSVLKESWDCLQAM